ncbi:MAG: DUF2207 domain-containing protein, partial [Bacteroidales bacterium]|nr:DUF2207 domain-containing protein [Bacteroidales bacterium]
KGFDEFYFNLIGDNWDTTIDQVAFTITMPKPFDASKVGFTSGVAGSTYSGHVTFEVNGHVISGTYNRTLKAEEALTIRLELPDGYFVVEEEPVDILTNTPIVLSCFFVLVAFGLWFKYGRGQRPVVTTEFYPPKDLNSAEVGFMYHGAADSNGVVSLLIYLANKGYIHIEETEEKELSAKSSGFKIKKLKEYDGDNTNERLFLAGLFKSNDEVRSADLQNSFYTTLNTIVGRLNANKHQIFEKSSINKNFYFVLMAIAIIVLITFRPVFEYGGLGELLSSLPFTGIGFIIFILFTIVRLPISMTINGRPTTSRVASMLLGLLFGATFGIPIFLLMVLPALLTDKTHVVVYIVGIICITLIFICMKHTKKRTPYGNDLLGRIMGFKDFLKIAEKPRLEQLVTKDPEYFYNILPFTYVLGISDKWIKKFETIALQAPNWYRGNKGFDSVSFSRFMSKTMTNASKAMTQSPSGGSSRSGGGGRSGGGSGGGGGRSR